MQTRIMDTKKDRYPVQMNSDFYRFLEVKTEKLVTAIYMITNFLSDKEPIKWRLRDVSLSMLTVASALKEKSPAEQTTTLSSMLLSVHETLSLLEISHLSGFISEMNYSVLRSEYESIESHIMSLPEVAKMTHKVALPKELFEDTHQVSDHRLQEHSSLRSQTPAQRESLPSYKGSAMERRAARDIYFPQKDKVAVPDTDTEMTHTKKDSSSSSDSPTPSAQTYGKVEKVKNKRRDVIVQMLRDNDELTIKDIAAEITDCSEKTIQRELVVLVNSGVVKRTGERRWSRYSLA